MHESFRGMLRVLLTCLALVTWALPSFGQAREGEANVPAAQKPPVLVGSVSVASLDKVREATAALGIDVPAFLTPAGLEQSFPIIGQGGLDPSRPLGLVLFAAPQFNLTRGEEAVFVLPVKQGAASLDGLLQHGAQRVPGSADAVEMNNVVFRRTPNHLMFSAASPLATKVKDSQLEELYPKQPAGKPQVIARFLLNPQEFATGLKPQFEAMLKNPPNGPPPRDPAAFAGYQFGQRVGLAMLESVRRFDLDLARGANRIQLKLTSAPMTAHQGGAVPRPGLPEGVVARLDMAFSPAQQLSGLVDQAFAEINNAQPAGGEQPVTPDQQRQLIEFSRAAGKVFLGGKAVSIGIIPAGGHTRVYIVQRHDRAPDFAAGFRDLADRFNKLTKTFSPKSPSESVMDVQEYTDEGGTKVARLRELENGKPTFFADATAKNGTVFLCLSGDERHHLSEVVALPARGTINGMASGSIYLDRMVAVLTGSGGALADSPKDRQDELAKIFAGRTLDFAAEPRGPDTVSFSLSVPEQLVAKLIQFVSGKPE